MGSLYKIIRLYVPGEPTVGRLVNMMVAFDAIYRPFVWDVERGDDMHKPTQAIHRLAYADVNIPGELISALISLPVNHRDMLQVQSVEVGSLIPGFSGIGEAIDASADLLQPTRRKQRKQALKHTIAMDEQAEQAAQLDNELKSMELIERKIRLLQQAKETGAISENVANQAIQQMIIGQDSAAELLGYENAEVIDIIDDDQREIAS